MKITKPYILKDKSIPSTTFSICLQVTKTDCLQPKEVTCGLSVESGFQQVVKSSTPTKDTANNLHVVYNMVYLCMVWSGLIGVDEKINLLCVTSFTIGNDSSKTKLVLVLSQFWLP